MLKNLYYPLIWGHLATSKRLLGKGLVNRDDVVAVAGSTQWAGTVAVDRQGNPLMNAVIWMDMRGAKYVRDTAKYTTTCFRNI